MDFTKLYNDLAPYIIAIYPCGSNTVPFITNNHDVDYVIYVTPDMPKKLHPQIFKYKQPNEDFFVRQFNGVIPCGWWSWSEKYNKPLIGEDILSNFDFFEHKYEWLDIARNTLKRFPAFDGQNSSIFKRCYHILAGLYVLENGHYNFSDEQIANIKLVHDGQMTQELHQFIVDKLNANV